MNQLPRALQENELYFKDGDPAVVDGYQRRILTGMRPSGVLHLGHYVGALKNWLKFQDQFDSTFLVADLHALADHMDSPEFVRQSVREVVLDWLAVGLNPQKADFIVQTGIPELENLTVLFETLVKLAEHQRNPTLKAEMERMDDKDKTVSFHNYPISQAADILGPMGDLVPAGQDQQPQIELTRNIARRFNARFAPHPSDFSFPLPQIYTGEVGRLVGTDGNDKMSKTLGNTIDLSATPDQIKKKVKDMKSPVKALSDPGVVGGHVVFSYLDAFHDDSVELQVLKEHYVRGGLGEGTLKDMLARDLARLLEPIREKRMEFAKRPDDLEDILRTGTRRTRVRVAETLEHVRSAMGMFQLHDPFDERYSRD